MCNNSNNQPAVVAKRFKSSTMFKRIRRAEDPGSNPAHGYYMVMLLNGEIHTNYKIVITTLKHC